MFTTLGYTTEKPYFIYGDVHAMSGYPMVGAGVRAQKGIHAFDFSGNTCLLNPPNSLNIFHLRSLYLVYPKQVGFYLGGGLGILNEPETIEISGSFESAIGYQWKNRVFLEGSTIVPFKQSQALAPVWPGLTFGVGF
ncbi:MAG: hypothetical protein A3E80_02720 [Chlamydiae bacterium RIFCSPHIGHO2_12_FULL_49_9]|nr:MAG: hypothetical protein A3E80_02720 [Chlamydiae bacterium RIFCSPHIGHO2_12_FULL_49_9]